MLDTDVDFVHNATTIELLRQLKDREVPEEPPQWKLPIPIWKKKLLNFEDPDFKGEFIDLITNGFHICDKAELICTPSSANYRQTFDDWHDCFGKINAKLEKGQAWGPFTEDNLPAGFENYQISNYFIKDERTKERPDKTRMLIDLSNNRDGDAVNDNIRKDEKTLAYITVMLIVKWIVDNNIQWLASADAEDAFHRVPLWQNHIKYMGIRICGVMIFFTSIMMGLASSCLSYTIFADMLCWIICDEYAQLFIFNDVRYLHHYLDDYLFGHQDKDVVWAQYRAILKLFKELNVPTQIWKMIIPTQILIYIGIVFDIVRRAGGISAPG